MAPFSFFLNALGALVLFASSALAVPTHHGSAPHRSFTHLTSRSFSSNSYWLDGIVHNGASPYNSNTSFVVYRNVKASKYGAKGDGVTDDYAAIQKALVDGDGCANSACSGSTIYPKVVYIPSGTYLISQTLQISMYTQLVGDPTSPPTIKPSSTFKGTYVLDGYPNTNGAYWNGGNAPLNFYKTIRNINVDTTNVNPNVNIKCLNWAVSQAASIRYMNFIMAQNGLHQGVDMQGSDDPTQKDNTGGSATMLGDLVFVNGNVGLTVSNQQFHFRNLVFEGCTTAISTQHLFIGVFQDITFTNCQTGIEGHPSGHSGFSSISLIDSTAVGLTTLISAPTQTQSSNIVPVLIDNLSTQNVITILQDENGAVILAGKPFGSLLVPSYARGVYYTDEYTPTFTQGQPIKSVNKPAGMLSKGKWYTKGKPVYSGLGSAQVVNVKDHGAKGDGRTDDLAVLQNVISSNAGSGKMIYFPYGVYRISNTLYIPPNTILQGEAWSSIRADGTTSWSDESKPKPILQVGKPGDKGTFAMTDMVVEPGNVYPGAKLVEVNMAGGPGDIGFWDCVFRTGGTASASNQASLCTTPGQECKSAWAILHITSSSSAYLENVWGWNADHGIDPTAGAYASSIQTGRGALIESTQPTFLVGVSMEHCTFYSIHPYNAQNLFLGMIQDESPYWQRDNPAPSHWTPNPQYGDPDFSNCATGDVNCHLAFGLHFEGGNNIFSYGSGVWTYQPNQTNDIWISENSPKNLVIFNPNNGGSSHVWTNIISVQGGGDVMDASSPGGWSGGVIAAYLPFAS